MNKFKQVLQFNTNKVVWCLFATLVICMLTFIIMIFYANSKRISENNNLESLKDKVDLLRKENPSPTITNIASIKEDTEYLNETIQKIQVLLGNPYFKALTSFVKHLTDLELNRLVKERERLISALNLSYLPKEKTVIQDQIDKINDQINNLQRSSDFDLVQNLLNSWNDYLIKQIKKQKEAVNLGTILNNFIISKGCTMSEFDKAKDFFLDELKKDCSEKIFKSNLDEYLLVALNTPPDITRVRCKEIVLELNKVLNNELHTKKLLPPSVSFGMFDEFSTVPNDDQIPYIIDYCRLYDDLIKRLCRHNILELTSYKKLNTLRGDRKGEFLIFKYQIEIIASQDAVRSFLDDLQNAYKDNRMYIINRIAFSKPTGEIADLSDKQKDIFLKKHGVSNILKTEITLDYIIFDKPFIGNN